MDSVAGMGRSRGNNRCSAMALTGGPEMIRTSDTRFRKPLLYPLSYGAGGSDYVTINTGV